MLQKYIEFLILAYKMIGILSGINLKIILINSFRATECNVSLNAYFYFYFYPKFLSELNLFHCIFYGIILQNLLFLVLLTLLSWIFIFKLVLFLSFFRILLNFLLLSDVTQQFSYLIASNNYTKTGKTELYRKLLFSLLYFFICSNSKLVFQWRNHLNTSSNMDVCW